MIEEPELNHLGTPITEVLQGEESMCEHTPRCPDANAPDCCSAHVVADHSEQGWECLCNGVILFDDGAYLSPDGHIAPVPHLV